MKFKWVQDYKIEALISIGLHVGLLLLLGFSNSCMESKPDPIKVITTVKLGSGGPGKPSHIAVKPPTSEPTPQKAKSEKAPKKQKTTPKKDNKKPTESPKDKPKSDTSKSIPSPKQSPKEKEPPKEASKEPAQEPSDDFDPSIETEPDMDPSLDSTPTETLDDPAIADVDPSIDSPIQSNGGSENPNLSSGKSSGPLAFGSGSAGDLELGLYEKKCRSTIYQSPFLNYTTTIDNTYVTVLLKINPVGKITDFKILQNDGDPQYLTRVTMVFQNLNTLAPPPTKWAPVFEEDGVELTLRPNK